MNNLLLGGLLYFKFNVPSVTNVAASTLTDSISPKGWGGYTTNSFSALNAEYTANTSTSNVTIGMWIFNGSTGAVRGNQTGANANFGMRNTTAYPGAITEIKLIVTGGTINASSTTRNLLNTSSSLAFSIPESSTTGGTKVDQTTDGQSIVTWTISALADVRFFRIYHLFAFGTAVAGAADSIQITYQTSSPSESVNVTGVTLNKSTTSLNVGDTEQLTATVSPPTATNKSVSWTSSASSVASVSSTGLITALSVGTTKITVTTIDGGFIAECDVSVTSVSVTGITLNKTSTSLILGQSEQIIATIEPPNATNKNIVWTSSEISVATVSSTGVINTFSVGQSTITATTTDGDFTATLLLTVTPYNPSTTIVISEVYGGGGNSESFYKNDFIELYNFGDVAVNLTGWSVQNASSTGTSWQVTALSGMINPKSFYLVQQAAGTAVGGGTQELPRPDVIGTISIAASNTKVALFESTVAFSGSNPIGNLNLRDFVGIGTSNAAEGSLTAKDMTNSNSVSRIFNDGLIQDTNVNSDDFISINPPTPTNSAMSLRDKLSFFNTCNLISTNDINSLSADYNNLSSGENSAQSYFATLTVSDFSFDDYTNNNLSYSGIERTITVNALEKLDALIARYNANNPNNIISRNLESYGFENYKDEANLIIRFVFFILLSLLFINGVFLLKYKFKR